MVFIFKYLAELNNSEKYKVPAIIKDGNIIAIKISNNNGVSITIRDSYLLLTASLLKGSKTFKCELKGVEPVLQYSDRLTESEKYDAHKDTSHYSKDIKLINNYSIWFKLITEYCVKDCTVLYHIIIKFKNLIYGKFSIYIEDFPTISSLSFAIYRWHYLKSDRSITSDEVFNFIRESYTGWSTDKYKPSGKNIYCYDVNYLYPFVMKNNLYPVGPINIFDGDINYFKWYLLDSRCRCTIKKKKN